MKNTKHIGCLVFILMCLITNTHGQSLGEQLDARIEGKTKLADIMAEVHNVYAQATDEVRSKGGDDLMKYKRWLRWEWYMKSRLGPDGEFVNLAEKSMNVLSQVRQHSSSRANAGDWRTLGNPIIHDPEKIIANIGRVDRIAFHPTDANTFYISAPYGGVWKTTDGGATWAAKGDYLASIGVGGLVVDRDNPNTIYAFSGTGDSFAFPQGLGYDKVSAGVFKSTDGGDTWNPTGNMPLPSGVTSHRPFSLIQNPFFPNIFYASSSAGVFITVNNGGNWDRLKDGLHYEVAVGGTASNQRLYASDAANVYYADNGSWNTAIFNINPNPDVRVAIGTTNSDTVYAHCGGNSGVGTFPGFYRSTNAGVNFTRMSNTPNICGWKIGGNDAGGQSDYTHTIVVKPTDNNFVVTGGVNIYKTTNGGANFNITSIWHNPPVGSTIQNVHADQHMLAYNPVDGKLYSCNDGGIDVSADDGLTWTDISYGIDLGTIYHMTSNDEFSYKIITGDQDNGNKLRDKSTERQRIIGGGDGVKGVFMAGHPNTVYQIGLGANPTVERKTLTSDTTFSAVVVMSSTLNRNINFLAAHPTDSNIIFAGGSQIWKSIDKGVNWTPSGGNGQVDIEFDRNNPMNMYACNGVQVYRSTNGGDSFQPISMGNPSFPTTTAISGVMGSGLNIAVSIGGYTDSTKVFVTTDGGAMWHNYSFNLPNTPIHSIAGLTDLSPTSSAGLYVGTNEQVFSLNEDQNGWINISDNLPLVPITDIYVDEKTGNLQVSTFGRGLWQYDFCIDDLNLTVKQEGVFNYKCSEIMTTTSEIPGDAENDVRLTAGSRILMKPGFQATYGSRVEAKIGACDFADIP